MKTNKSISIRISAVLCNRDRMKKGKKKQKKKTPATNVVSWCGSVGTVIWESVCESGNVHHRIQNTEHMLSQEKQSPIAVWATRHSFTEKHACLLTHPAKRSEWAEQYARRKRGRGGW